MAALDLEVESWVWYSLTWLVVIVRMVSRRILLGSWKKLQIEDALMILAMMTYTVLIVAMNIVSDTSSNLIDPNDPTPLDADNIKERRFGSKMVLVVEQMQCITIWLVKACLLIMYHRLTYDISVTLVSLIWLLTYSRMSLRQNVAVKFVAGYVAVTFVVMEILYLGVWCRPIQQYWAVPPDNTQCSAATNHLITNAVFNISSDVMIILIPMPIFLQSSLSLKRKVVLCIVFAVGTFTIVSAALNKYYSFNQPFGHDWTFWYIRESSTALIAANLPLTWTLLQRLFNLRSFAEKYSNQQSGNVTTSRFRSGSRHIQGSRTTLRGTLSSAMDRSRSDSEERINAGFQIPLKIYQKREVEVSTLPAGPQDSQRKLRMSSADSLPDQLKTVVDVKGGHYSRQYEGGGESASEKSVGAVV